MRKVPNYQLHDWRARSFVLSRGKNGFEHAYCYCRNFGRFYGHNTDNLPNSVTIPLMAVGRCKDSAERVSFHHNHPGRTPLSFGDVELLGRLDGLQEISAHTVHGGFFRARKNSRYKTTWTNRFYELDQKYTFQSLTYQNHVAFPGALEMHVFLLLLHKHDLIVYDFVLDKDLRIKYDKNRSLVQLIMDFV